MTDIDKLKEEYKNVRAVFGAFKCRLDAAIQKAEYIAHTEEIAYQKGYESGKAETEIRLLDKNGEWAKELKHEAYQNGLAEGMVHEQMKNGKMVKEAYEKGTRDGNIEGALTAWDIATIIVTPVECGGTIASEDLRSIFKVDHDHEVFAKYTPSEALKILQDYENAIRIGDEVVAEGKDKFIVTTIKDCDSSSVVMYGGIDLDGEVYSYFTTDGIEKTGNHFNISEVLSDLRIDPDNRKGECGCDRDI